MATTDARSAFFGDIVRGQAPPSVKFEQANFHLAQGCMCALNAQTITQALADPNVELFDPLDPNDAPAEVVRLRNTVLFPVPTLECRDFIAGSLQSCWPQHAGTLWVWTGS
jgi:hypothetical protein